MMRLRTVARPALRVCASLLAMFAAKLAPTKAEAYGCWDLAGKTEDMTWCAGQGNQCSNDQGDEDWSCGWQTQSCYDAVQANYDGPQCTC